MKQKARNNNRSVESQLYDLLFRRVETLLLLGALFFLLLAILDYVVVPHLFSSFLLIRATASTFLLICFVVLQKLKNKRPPLLPLVFTGTAVSVSAIELMILKFNAHQSPYYAGIVLLVIFVLGMLPLSFKVSLAIAVLTHSVYLIPILIFDQINNMQTFFTNNFFLGSILVTLLFWRQMDQRRLRKELILTNELSEQQAKILEYSHELERLVEQRNKELSMSEILLDALFENASDGILITNIKGGIIRANRKACELHGFDKLEGMNMRLLEVPSGIAPWEERVKQLLEGHPLVYEVEHYHKNGHKIPLEVSCAILEINEQKFVQLFCRDISERKKLQAELIYSQKMESIGIMAGGIAHDFNNLLAAILGNVELLSMHEEIPDFCLQKLKDIEQAARSASQIVSKLLDFARRKPSQMVTVNLNDVIHDSIRLISHLKPDNVKIDLNLTDSSIIIKGDPIRLEQVLVNVILNAFDAMPHGGTVKIETAVEEKGSERNVRLSVSDTGTGIRPEHLPHIFDPFFTTKKKGRGTGLGLAVVYGIVKEHHGKIDVETTLGQGTTFHMRFPLIEEIPKEVQPPRHVERSKHPNTVLVVDDEERILSFVKDVLEREGFNVIATTSPTEALEIFKVLRRSLQLVITDLVMPEMEGKFLIENLKKLSPKTKIIVITGYPSLAQEVSVEAILPKPFDASKLVSTVKSFLKN